MKGDSSLGALDRAFYAVTLGVLVALGFALAAILVAVGIRAMSAVVSGWCPYG